ncbi:RNA 3'-terminal phosphate cyclase [Duganella sp. Root198D2]|uniref:RNA 3'-terminal phosphate cyclase n=1 Tax=Duganella sp. Root198D2 TaxID=1736489 RepID=UPI00070B9B61|nr:RNA 3'-terminal phosphate cyclase [Duganella sp. Root198D2]KRB88429.1 RNA 3'-phosphate cyclase [Duganella sp. Root198D2]
MIELDGSTGEGGGQILRTSLTLSMITGQAFRIRNIRANRQPPGLRRQHLSAVRAAAIACCASVSHAEVGSTSLEFEPGRVSGGVYDFDIGTAGSTTLVLQTLIPALLFAEQPATVTVTGGTHNPKAPPAEFLQRAYCRVLAAMGANVEIDIERYGFYPAGGGSVSANVWPCKQLRRLDLLDRGGLQQASAQAIAARLPAQVAQRQYATVRNLLGWGGEQMREVLAPVSASPGNAVLLTVESETVTELFSAIGDRGVRAEAVAREAALEARRYLASSAAVGEHLGDQLMLPMALAGGGSYTLDHVSQHAVTNAEVITHFLPVTISFEQSERFNTCHLRAKL